MKTLKEVAVGQTVTVKKLTNVFKTKLKFIVAYFKMFKLT